MRDQGRVRLRDVSADDIALIDAWDADPVLKGEFNDFGQPPHSIRQDFEAGKIVGDDHGLLVVERVADAAPIGTVSWRAVHYGPPPDSRAWQIGIALVPEGRGQGFGAEAQRLLADHLFATTDAFRVEASTDVDNVAEQRALERAGYRREGVNRGAQVRPSGRHDLVLYARLRTDP
ncbi:MAG TPA: GNAT family protein [Candidatus Limnocylindria bacterium]|nr:GNAT family protein [Candidatus Limnocylindria bacterium]